MSKPAWRSKMIWFNGAVGTIASLLLTAVVVAQENIELLMGEVSNTVYLGIIVGLTVVNQVLRMVTSQPITLRPGDD